LKRNLAIQIAAVLVTILAVLAGFVAAPLLHEQSGAPAVAAAAGTSASIKPPAPAGAGTAKPYVPPPPGETGEGLKEAMAKARAEEDGTLAELLETELAAGEYAAAAKTMNTILGRGPAPEKKQQLERDLVPCSAIAEADALRLIGRFDKAIRILYPIAADESQGKWAEIARRRVADINSANAAADSMLSAASARIRMKKPDEAKEILNQLIEKYPALPQAESARALLLSLKSGGK
jgi:tetratricopeptide (TPR) repeat protein